jgi:hypothetical protein
MLKTYNNDWKKIAGAHIWIDWALVGPMKDRMFKFMGTHYVGGRVYYNFAPYNRVGKVMMCDWDTLCAMTRFFKPLLITPADMYGDETA